MAHRRSTVPNVLGQRNVPPRVTIKPSPAWRASESGQTGSAGVTGLGGERQAPRGGRHGKARPVRGRAKGFSF
jgi:hypothetical protein